MAWAQKKKVFLPGYRHSVTKRNGDAMTENFSQLATHLPLNPGDHTQKYLVIDGYPVLLSFSEKHQPEVFERVRDILLATSYASDDTKKAS